MTEFMFETPKGTGWLWAPASKKATSSSPVATKFRSCIEFPRWTYAGGKPRLGLLLRRLSEVELFLSESLPS